MGATYYVSTAGSDSTGDGSSGNPYASPGKAGAVMSGTGNTVYIKSGSYSQTSGSSNVAGGLLVMPAGASGAPNLIKGYSSTIGDLDNINDFTSFPTILGTGSGSAYCLRFSSSYCRVENLILDAGSQASRGLAVEAGFCSAVNCKATRASSYGFYVDGSGFVGFRLLSKSNGYGIYCDYYDCIFSTCVVTGNSTVGVAVSGYAATFANVISHANTGGTVDGFLFSGANGSFLDSCVSWGNGRDGVRFADATSLDIANVRNCILGSNGGYNLRSVTTTWGSLARVDRNFLYTSTSGNYSGLSAGPNDVTLSGDPFTDASTGDFSLNATSGAGASVRSAGYPGVFPGGLTTGYRDGGAAQHEDSGGGGGSGPTYFSF